MGLTKRILIGTDITQSRRRIRWAYICGYLYAGVCLLNTILLFSAWDSEVSGLWSTGQSVFVVLESSLIAIFSFGLSRRNRMAAIGLFVYFSASRVPLLILGYLPAVNELDDLVRLVVSQVLPAYLFLQGLRGVLTFRALKHMDYQEKASDS